MLKFDGYASKITATSNSIMSEKLQITYKWIKMYYCDQKILDTKVIVLSYILKRPLCINNLNFDCVNFENVNVRFTEKILKKL
jgi:hypothetical protein